MKKNLKKGFTLIELLVVIAIIGILSGIVIASLNTARNKGADAAIRGNLNGIRTQAELFYDNETPNTYEGLCTSLSVPLTAIKNVSGASEANNIVYTTAGAASTVTCHENAATGWAVESPLKSSSEFACVDSSGNSTTTSASTLDASDAICG